MRFDPTSLRRTDRTGLFRSLALAVLLVMTGSRAGAQVTPAAGYTPPDDTPSIKIGAVIFADYTYQSEPTARDAAGVEYNPNSFNVARTYVNVTGNISHLVSYRITPDVARLGLAGNPLDGSTTFRLKYGYAQINLSDWLPSGTWVRFGMQQTPFIDSVESIYRYRFQGTVFAEREGYMSSADFGVAFRTQFPNNYGDVHVGVYNGEGYGRAEVNGQKAKMLRVGLKPLPRHRFLKTWRLQGFWTWDSYMKDAPRNRAVFNTTFEHAYLNVGFDYIDTRDKTASTLIGGLPVGTLDGKGWSLWLTPKKVFASNGSSVELLARYDRLKPGGTVNGATVSNADGLNERTIVGGAYWFPKQGSVSAALLFDVQYEKYRNWTPAKTDATRFYVHSLISF